jgi:hypothetical protein
VKFCELCGTPVDDSLFSQPPQGITAGTGPQPPKVVPRIAVVARRPEPDVDEYGPDEEEDDTSADREGYPHEADEPFIEESTEDDVQTPVPEEAFDDLPPDPLIPPDGDDEKPQPPARRLPVRAVLVIGGVLLLIALIAAAFIVVFPMPGAPISPGPPPVGVATPAPAVSASPSQEPEVPVTTNTVPPAPPPTMPVFSLETQPVENLPKGQDLYFEVFKDPISGQITVNLAGGPGINSISTADVTVTREDGTVIRDSIRPSSGAREIVLAGSRDADRVEIIAVMYSGKTFRVYDEVLSYKKR